MSRKSMPIPNIPEKHAQANQGWVGRAKKRAIKKETRDAVDKMGVTKVRVAASETSLAQDEQRLRIQAEERCTTGAG